MMSSSNSMSSVLTFTTSLFWKRKNTNQQVPFMNNSRTSSYVNRNSYNYYHYRRYAPATATATATGAGCSNRSTTTNAAGGCSGRRSTCCRNRRYAYQYEHYSCNTTCSSGATTSSRRSFTTVISNNSLIKRNNANANGNGNGNIHNNYYQSKQPFVLPLHIHSSPCTGTIDTLFVIPTIRHFSSNDNKNNDDGNNIINNDYDTNNNNNNNHHDDQKERMQNRLVDKEFVEYLTGKFDDEEENTSNNNHHQQQQQQNEEPYNQQQFQQPSSTITPDYFNILFHNNNNYYNNTNSNNDLNETYKKIQLTQSINIEKSRKQRLITVRRALGGNVIIALSKLAAFLHSGSSAMLSEFIHSVVDCGNQSLLLVGLRDSGLIADRSHQYGYGKSIYFWALVSALGTFFLGAGVSMTQALPNLIYGNYDHLHEITWHVWSVLGFSFVVDGYVFTRTLMEVNRDKPSDVTLYKHIAKLRDPATLAILLEDGAACLGVVMAIGGLGLTQAFDMPIYDSLAGVGIGGLLASMGVILVRVNHRFLLGQSVDKEIRVGIEKILLNRKSIDAVHSVQSQWTGAETFSFKAEVDFDGTFLAAKLMPRYQQEFAEARSTLDQDLRVLLSWYAEDVMRTVEREVRSIEAEIRKEYPGAQYIELEPMSKDADRFAIDDGLEASLKRIEIESLNRYLKSLYDPDSLKIKSSTNTSTNSTTKTAKTSNNNTNNNSSNEDETNNLDTTIKK